MKPAAKPVDPREVKLSLITSAFVCCVFLGALWYSYIQPPIHTVVIYEVWRVEHPADRYTVIYTRGQGRFAFHGVHDIQPGRSYRIAYQQLPDPNRDLTMVSFQEVHLPG